MYELKINLFFDLLFILSFYYLLLETTWSVLCISRVGTNKEIINLYYHLRNRMTYSLATEPRLLDGIIGLKPIEPG